MFYNKLYKLADKFAALTDEQYKAILKNPNLLQLLDRTNRLDEFYRSMPEVPLSEIEDRMQGISKGIVENRKRQFSEKMQKFVENYGAKQIPIDLLKQINAGVLKDEKYSDEEAKKHYSYIEEITFEDLLFDYLSSGYYNEEKIKDFMYFYGLYQDLVFDYESLTEKEKSTLNELSKKVSQILITIMKSIFATKSMEHDAAGNLMRAYNIRKSDYFDFLDSTKVDPIEDIEPVSVEESVENIEYPNYKDAPTK